MNVSFSNINISFEKIKKANNKNVKKDSFRHLYKLEARKRKKEKQISLEQSGNEIQTMPKEALIVGYFPNVSMYKETDFIDKYKKGVKLSDGKVLLRPISKRKEVSIIPDDNNNKYRKKYAVIIEDNKTKEVKTKVLSEKELLQDERFCAGIIERKEKDSFNIFYSTNGYQGCIIRANSNECEQLMERERIQF